MTKEQRLLHRAREMAKGVDAWADLSNMLYNAEDGLLTRAYRTRSQRETFAKTEEYKEIRNLIWQTRERTGLVEGATPRKSGKFVVRLPESLHAALEREARAEGVSLNQLVVAKLAVQLKDATKRKRRAR